MSRNYLRVLYTVPADALGVDQFLAGDDKKLRLTRRKVEEIHTEFFDDSDPKAARKALAKCREIAGHDGGRIALYKPTPALGVANGGAEIIGFEGACGPYKKPHLEIVK